MRFNAPVRHQLQVHILIIAVALLACAEQQGSEEVDRTATAEAGDRLSVFVVNYPLRYFAERIGGDRVEVSFPAPGDVDPAYWSPDAETIAAFQGADLILLNGAGYAKWVELSSLPQAKLVDTSAAFRDRYIPLDEGMVHTHGPEGEHSHKGWAFTTWLDPTLAIEQARAVSEALSGAIPARAASFQAAFEELAGDLRALDASWTAAAEALNGQRLLFSHPVYQYLERRYGLNGKSVHWEPDQEPGAEMWTELDELLADHPARWMIWEDAPLASTAAGLEQRGIASLVYQPASNVPSKGDLLAAMRADLSSLEGALAGARPPERS